MLIAWPHSDKVRIVIDPKDLNKAIKRHWTIYFHNLSQQNTSQNLIANQVTMHSVVLDEKSSS